MLFSIEFYEKVTLQNVTLNDFVKVISSHGLIYPPIGAIIETNGITYEVVSYGTLYLDSRKLIVFVKRIY